MKSDDAANKIVHLEWDRIKGKDSDDFFAVIKIGDFELSRIQISRQDYASDTCVPCESKMKRVRNEIAKGLREEYGE